MAERSILFECNFETDTCNPEELAAAYPFIKAAEPGTITVSKGELIKKGSAQADQLFSGQEGCTDITYAIDITCDHARYNIGLGCYVGKSGTMNCFCFHPGMRGGEFRIEGSGGHFNTNLGFTPPDKEAGEGGCRFEVTLRKDGCHKVTITHPKGISHTSEWINKELWAEDAESSPPFGIYDGNIVHRGGHVFYQNFSVSSESARTRVWNMEVDRLEDGTVKLTFTDLAGNVVHKFDAKLQDPVNAMFASLAEASPDAPVKVLAPGGTLLERGSDLTFEGVFGDS